MATITSKRAFEIGLGTAAPEEDTRYLLGTLQTGTPGAKRRLVHPDSDNWPPISYQQNPDWDANIDNELVPVPVGGKTVLTAESTKVIRWARTDEDVIVRERWTGGAKEASMETWFFRLLIEYWLNPPAINPSAQTYIQWEPRDRNAYVYNVEIVSIQTGSGKGELSFTDLVPYQGDIGGGMQDSDVPGSGILLEPVELVMKIVSQEP